MSIGRLIVEFEAQTGKFETDMGRAAKIMERRAREIDAKAQRLGKAIGTALGVGIAGSIAALTALTKRAINAGDEFAKLSQKTGVTVEALSALDYAAKLSGVEDLGDSLTKLNRTITEAAQGSKTQAAAFEAIGVAVTDANGQIRPTEDVLRDVAEAFSRYENGAAKTALAMDLFGESGTSMIPLLNGGSAALDRATKRAKELGIVLSSETATASEAFNDALSDVGFAMDGVGRSIATSLAPRLKGLADIVADPKFTDGLRKIVEVAVAGTEAVARLIVKIGSAGKTRETSNLQREADFLQSTIERRTKGRGVLEFFGRDVDGEVARMQERLAAIRAQLADASQTNFDAAMLAEAEALERLGQAAAAADPIVLNYSGTTGRSERASRGAAKATDEWASSLESAAAIQAEAERLSAKALELDAERALIFEQTRTPAERLAATIERLNELFANGTQDSETYNRAVRQAQDSFDAATMGAQRLDNRFEDTTDNMSKYAERARENMQDSMAQFFKSFDQGAKGMVRSFVDALNDMAAQLAAAEFLKLLVGDGKQGSSFADSLLGSAVSAAVGFFSGGASSSGTYTAANIPGRANGGSVDMSRMYMVGERGPELFVPKTAGTIVPNSALGAAPVVNLRNVNAFDTQVVGDYMNSAAGEQVFLNLVSRNGAKIKNVVSG